MPTYRDEFANPIRNPSHLISKSQSDEKMGLASVLRERPEDGERQEGLFSGGFYDTSDS